MLNFCDFIQNFVFITNHHLNLYFNIRFFLGFFFKQTTKFAFHFHVDKALCGIQTSYNQRQKYSEEKKVYMYTYPLSVVV